VLKVRSLFLMLLCAFVAVPAAAQSPNTATIVVVVTDQSGSVVKDAKVSVVNNQTGGMREASSGSDGTATVAALSLTGVHTVTVAKQGFRTEDVRDITLRAGETATLRVKLLVGAEKSEVTVYGTTEGVRADPQVGRRLNSQEIDVTPLLGRNHVPAAPQRRVSLAEGHRRFVRQRRHCRPRGSFCQTPGRRPKRELRLEAEVLCLCRIAVGGKPASAATNIEASADARSAASKVR
jgi:carboxypeptidase family protein